MPFPYNCRRVDIVNSPAAAIKIPYQLGETSHESTWQNVIKGVSLIFMNKYIRFALSIEFVSAIPGAQILVNTIGHIKAALHLADTFYGWLMAAFGVGAAIAAFVAGSIDKSKSRKTSLILGGLLIGIAISVANIAGYPLLLVLWLFAGLGQSLAKMPSETLIGENIQEAHQGKVYGAILPFLISGGQWPIH